MENFRIVILYKSINKIGDDFITSKRSFMVSTYGFGKSGIVTIVSFSFKFLKRSIVYM